MVNEEKILKDFFDKWAIPLKYYSKMIKNIDNKLYSDLEYKEEKQ